VTKITKELQEKLDKLEIYGCGDGNCIVKRNRGQHTNGGCHCLDRLDTAKRMEIRKYILVLRGEL